MDWNDVRYFLALAKHGSVRAAGALRSDRATSSVRIQHQPLITQRLQYQAFAPTRIDA